MVRYSRATAAKKYHQQRKTSVQLVVPRKHFSKSHNCEQPVKKFLSSPLLGILLIKVRPLYKNIIQTLSFELFFSIWYGTHTIKLLIVQQPLWDTMFSSI